MLITQYSMKYVEQASLVKFDFLGLKTLTVIEQALAILKGQGIEVDIARIPLDDEKTFAMLRRGDAAGVFQFEGAGHARLPPPDAASTASRIWSPPSRSTAPARWPNIPAYCARKHGEPWESPHPGDPRASWPRPTASSSTRSR